MQKKGIGYLCRIQCFNNDMHICVCSLFLPAARSDIAGQALTSFIDLGPITRLLSEHFVGAFTQSGSTNLCLNLVHDL